MRTPLIAINSPLSHNFPKQTYLSTLELAPRNKQNGMLWKMAPCTLVLPQNYTLKMEALRFSETMVTNYQATRCHNPQDYNMNRNLRQNIRHLCAELYRTLRRDKASRNVCYSAPRSSSTLTHFLKTHLELVIPSLLFPSEFPI